MSKILILGGHGFVGKNLFSAFKDTNHRIFLASRKDGIDLMDLSSTRECFLKTKPDAIFNCAASVGSVHFVSKNMADVLHTNLIMVLNIYKAAVEACPKTRIINPIANCAYPANRQIYSEFELLNGDVHESVYGYGYAKRMIYVSSFCYKKQYSIKSVNFLVPNLFGPADDTDPNKVHAINGLIIRMIKSHLKGEKKFEVWGSGKPIREWGYIGDLVKVLKKGLTINQDLTYPVNFAQNKGYSIRESAKMIAKAIGYNGELIFNTKYQDGAPVKIMDDARFKKLFPNFTFTNHEKAVKKTVEHYWSLLNK